MAERVMGLAPTPPRDLALAIVGQRWVLATGRTLALRNGWSLDVPRGLPGRPADRDVNDRSYRFVAEWLLARDDAVRELVEQELAACRLAPLHYSTDVRDAFEAVRHLAGRGVFLMPEQCQCEACGADDRHSHGTPVAKRGDWLAHLRDAAPLWTPPVALVSTANPDPDAVATGAPPADSPAPAEGDGDEALLHAPHTDIGNAERLVARHDRAATRCAERPCDPQSHRTPHRRRPARRHCG